MFDVTSRLLMTTIYVFVYEKVNQNNFIFGSSQYSKHKIFVLVLEQLVSWNHSYHKCAQEKLKTMLGFGATPLYSALQFVPITPCTLLCTKKGRGEGEAQSALHYQQPPLCLLRVGTEHMPSQAAPQQFDSKALRIFCKSFHVYTF